jgi:hypothetical protein
MAVVLGAAAALTFARGLSYGFAWDDHRIIETSARMHERSTVYEAFVQPSTWVIGDGAVSPIVTYRPLAISTMALDYAVWSGHPYGFHLTNLALHAACVVLFFRLLLRLKVSARASAMLALLLAVHPVAAEAITWIDGRSEPLCLLFGLITLELCARETEPGTGRLAGLALSLFAALLSKETAAFFVPIALGLLVRQHSRVHLRRGSAALLVAALCYVGLRANALAGGHHTGQFALALWGIGPLWMRALQAALWPVDLGLENLLAWQNSIGTLERGASWLLALGLVGACGWCLHRRRWLPALGLAWWLGSLLPTCVTFTAGGYWPGLCRWVYLALPGLLLCLAPLLERFIARKAVLAAGLVVALLLALESQRAAAVWRDDDTLLRHMIARYPKDWYAHSQLARYKVSLGDVSGALSVLRAGRQSCGPNSRLSCMEGQLLARSGQCELSDRMFADGPDCQALAGIDPWATTGECYFSRGDYKRARRVLKMCEDVQAVCRELLERLPR